MDPKRPIYQDTVQWTILGLTEPFFGFGWLFVISQAKSREVCTVYWTTGYFSKTERRFATKRSVWPSSTLKTVDLGYRSSLSVAWMVRFWFKSLQNSTVHKRPLVQSSLFLLAVYTHEVPLYLCSVFCNRSQVRLSTASYRAFGARTTPHFVSRYRR